MNKKLYKVKNKLLELGYTDNEYLDKYLALIEQNLETPRDSLRTQAHHVIPTKDFAENSKHYKAIGSGNKWHYNIARAESDEANFRVNLLYKDHLCAHNLLALCRNLDEIQKNYEDYCSRRQLERTSLGSAYNVKMPKYITEEKILEKLGYYTRLYEEAPDERTAHKYRTNVAHWRSKHRQYLENPEKYNPASKPTVKQYIKNEQLHLTAKRKRELKQLITDLHAAYSSMRKNFSSKYHIGLDQDVETARLAWKQAVNEYNEFCLKHSRAKTKVLENKEY